MSRPCRCRAVRPFAAAVARGLAVWLGGMFAAAPAVAQVAVSNPTVGTQPREIVYNAAALKPFVDAAKTRRVDIAGVGDSNHIGAAGGYGWEHGYSKAWSDRFGWYSTGVQGLRPSGGWDGPQGYVDRFSYPYGSSTTGAPAALHKYRLWTDSQPDNENDFSPAYAYYGPGYVEPTNHWNAVAQVRKEGPLWGRNLKWHLTYGTFDTGNGGFTPSASTAAGKIIEFPRVQSSTGAFGLKDATFAVPYSAYGGSAHGDAVSFGVSYVREGTLRGPFFGLWQRVESDRPTGMSYSTMLWQGGRALVHAATGLKQQPDEAIREYVRTATKLQNGAPPMLMVQVMHGGNDAAASIPSVGPNPAPSNTPAGFRDNMHALVTRLRGIWTGMGYDPKNLIFQYGPYHPVEGETFDNSGVSRVQRLAGWENSIIGLSQQHPEYNIAVVRGSRLTTPIAMLNNGWYDPEGSAHLTAGGYIGVAELGVRQVLAYTRADALDNRSVVTSLSFTFNSDVSAELSPDDLLLREIASDTLIKSEDLAVDWNAATRTATWTFHGLALGELPVGEYEAIIRTSQLGSGGGGGGASLRAADATGLMPTSSGDYHFTFVAAPIPEPAMLGLVPLVAFALSRRRARR